MIGQLFKSPVAIVNALMGLLSVPIHLHMNNGHYRSEVTIPHTIPLELERPDWALVDFLACEHP